MEEQFNGPTVVGIGEALFDCFPEGALLGGAPVNLAVHADQLLNHIGGRGVVVSAVGQDELGGQIHRELAARRMSVDFLQQSSDYATGTVQVTVDDAGHPEYEITENVAWDHIRQTESNGRLAKSCSAVCFGTLAQRTPESRATIQQFLAAAPQAWRVCDLNLRQQFFSKEVIENSFTAANVVKLSEEELGVASSLFKIERADADAQAALLCERFELELLALTRGARGTVLFRHNERAEGEVPTFPSVPQADSVGAGDSCCAAIVTGLLLKWPTERIVSLANRVGAYVASQRGATPRLPREILAEL
jgi:fructokinase